MDVTSAAQTQPRTVDSQLATEPQLSEKKRTMWMPQTDEASLQSAITKQPQMESWQPAATVTQPQLQYPTGPQYYWYPSQREYYPAQQYQQQYPQPQQKLQQQQQSQTVVVVNNQTSQNMAVWSSGLCGCMEDMNSCKKKVFCTLTVGQVTVCGIGTLLNCIGCRTSQ
jgi:hypothetical protein